MEEKKSLFDISWKVSEEEYRADSALSYSTLAKYERSGFNELEHLADKVESPSLTFGSCVDSIITGGQQEFDDRFIVAEFPDIPDSIVTIVKNLYTQYGEEYRTLDSIPTDKIIMETIVCKYQLNWKPETRAKVIKEKGSEYYSLLYVAGDKTIINTELYSEITASVDALKTSEATKFYFAPDDPFDDSIERLYQLKFKGTLDGIDYRCMADEIIVDHKNKIVYPKDLKTSSHTEWDFHQSFVQWNYQIQARLYWRLIRQTMDKDPYFKDFKLADYEFIVVNKKTLTPLVWKFNKTQALGTITYGKNNQIEMRDPQEIGKELFYYLSSRPQVPIDIKQNESNNLDNWLNKL